MSDLGCSEFYFHFDIHLNLWLKFIVFGTKGIGPMKRVARLCVCWLLRFCSGGKRMDLSAVATVGIAAVVAVADLTAEATRSTADGGHVHVVRGLSQASQSNENSQEEQGKQYTD